jgi:hypothetical protein
MSKNQKGRRRLFNINKKFNLGEKPKISGILKNNISEDKEENKNTKEFLPKLIIKKETYNNNASILNQKRERAPSNSKEGEDNNNLEDKSINSANNISNRKRTSLNEAKKEMKEFESLILNIEKEIQRKYGFIFPDLSFEDNLPNDIKSKLLDDFLDNPRIKKILDEANEQK